MYPRRLHTAYNVSANRWLLQRYAYVEERLFIILGDWIWTLPQFEHKVELGVISYSDARHTDGLRNRIQELAPSTEDPIRLPDFESLEAFCNEVANADESIERFVGLFRVLKPQLLAAYRQHQTDTDELIDGPTAMILQDLIVEEEQHIAWGEEVLRSLITTPVLTERASAWKRHLESAWETMGGVRESRAGPQPAYRNPESPMRHRSDFPARDERFHVVPIQNYNVPPPSRTAEGSLAQLLFASTHGELEAEEVLSRVLADAPDLPWPMRLDLARQMWDEARHAQMSWQRMQELGGLPDPTPPVISSIVSLLEGLSDPLERLIVLQRAVEGMATDLVRQRMTAVLDQFEDPKTARLFEYIIADERGHIGYSEWVDHLVGVDTDRMAELMQVQAEAERAYFDLVSRARQVRAAAGHGEAR